MRSVLLSIILTISFVAPTQAEEPITWQNLKVVGRGLVNRKTQDVLALVCTGNLNVNPLEHSCDHLRHVVFRAADKTSSFIGPEFDLKVYGEASLSDLSSFAQKLGREVRAYKHTHNQKRRVKTIAIFSGISMATFVVATATNPHVDDGKWHTDTEPTPIQSKIAIGAFAAAIGTFAVLGITDGVTINKGGIFSEAVIDQDGWNWSVLPDRISQNSFHWYERFLLSSESSRVLR